MSKRHRLNSEPAKLLFSPIGIVRDMIIAALLFVIAWRCVPDVLGYRLLVLLVALPTLLVLDYIFRYIELNQLMKTRKK